METVNGVPEGDKGGPPPPSPLTGCYLLIVVGEPYTEQHKDIILQRIAKGLLSWEVNSCLVDLEKELAIITEQALEGEEARYGERLIQFASENLVTEILIHPVVSTLAQCMRNLLSSFTRHRHIIHSGYTFAANGSWALQDGTFSYSDFSEAFQEIEVQRVIHAYENGISLDLHCSPEGEWTRLPKEQFAKACKARVNPTDVLTSGSPAIASFTNYLAPFLVPTTLENLLESSDVVGNIRFSRPTLYVFPGGQGDAALFGINGFNMLLDGGFSRKACFWDFVRHLDRLDAVLMTRLNNSNVGGIGSVLRRKKQDAVYPQLGHFFCNIQERRALLSPDGDKDKDPLLINLLDEGQEIISNLRHLNLNPQVCYRDSEPINLYHKVGHGTLDMYVLSPAKDSKEVREFLQKWNQCDQKLFANSKSSREFNFPIQNLISIAALLVWQPADPNDTITRILFPGSSPQNKIFEGLDRLKNLEFIKHSVCTERSLVPISITKKTAKDPILEKVTPKEKTPIEKRDNKIIENNIISAVNGDIKEKEKIVKKSDSTESDRSTKAKKTEEARITENGDKSKPKLRTSKSRSGSQQRKKTIEKKASPTTPKKIVENGESKKPSKPSPISTPAKSAKDANNRKVIESKAKREGVVKPQHPPEPKLKVERKPISRRPVPKKAPLSPAKKLVSGVQKPDSISRKGKLDKEGTTDSSTVSTPSADQETVLKKDLSKLTPDEIQQLKAQELADLKEEQEAIKEIEAVFRKGESSPLHDETLRKVRDDLIDEKLNKEEYLIVEKEEVEHESLSDTKENETQKLARDSEESEKQRKLSIEEKVEDISADIKKESEVEDIVKAKVDALESSKVSLEDKFEISTDKKTNGKEADDDVKYVMESQPDEKISANIKSGDTTTAPTLPEDERIPLDEIKEDNGHAIEEKYVKEETKEKEIPVIELPQKQHENISKLPGMVGIRLDKQQHIRDIVKTPDEVADLPVHEEVDYEFTHELKAETPKSNEIVGKQFEDHPETTKYSKEQEKEVEQEKDKDEVIQEITEQIENVSSIPDSELKIIKDDVLKDLEKDEKRKSLDGKDDSRGKPEHEPTTIDVGKVPSEAETTLDGFQSTKTIVESHDEQQYEKVLELKDTKPSEDKARQNVENGLIDSTIEKGEEDTKHVPSESVEGTVPEKREGDNISVLPTVIEVKSELDRINEGVLKAAKEDRYHLEKLDEKLQHLKQMEVEEDERHFSTIQSIKSVDISKEVEKSIEEATDDIMEDFTREVVVEKSLPKSPVETIEKVELGRKSPKEREDDVIKIVASVAEVLKSDAPLEEFEGKLPITTTISSYISPYTTELRETHITTVDSPVIEYKVIKTDIPTIPEEPHIASASFIQEEKKISEVHDSREENSEDKRSSLLKESQEFIMTTSRMISYIKSANPEELAKKDVLAGKVDDVDSIIVTDEKIEEEESGIIHRMLVTASSEDGGEETEICPPGTIIFPRSSESSGRSSPDPSQKVSQKSSVVETISDTVSTAKQVAELQSEKESGIIGKSEEIISSLPELKSSELSDGLSAALEKSEEISSQIMTSGKSSPDKDDSIKSLASGKSTPDMSELEKLKEVTSSSEDLKKEGDGRSIKESHSDKSISETPVDEKDVKLQTIATTEQTVARLEQTTREGTSESGVDPRQKSVVDVVEDTVERGIAAVTEFTKSIFITDEEYDENVGEHIIDKEITEGVNATRSVILVAKDGDKLSHDDTSKVFKEPEVPEIIESIEEDEHTADVEESQVGILVGDIGRRIEDAFDAVAEYIHPAKDQIDISEIIEKETGPEKVNETAAPKSAEIEFPKEQKEEKQEDLYASHEVSHSSQDTHGKIDIVIAKTKDAGEIIREELKVSLEETDGMKKDWSYPLNAKVIPQEHLIDEQLTEADKSSSEESIIVSKSSVAIGVDATTTVSSEEPSEHVQLKTEMEDSKLVLEAVHKVIGSTEIIKIPEAEIEPAENMSKSVNDLPKEIEGVVEEIPSSEKKQVNDIPEREISKMLDSSEISTSKLEKATTLDSTTANDISGESDPKTNITEPRKHEEQLAKLTGKIDSSPDEQKHFTDGCSDMYETKKPSPDDIPVESDHKIKDTSTIVSEQLDVAELGISDSKSIEKATKDDEQTAEQTAESDSLLEKQRLVIDVSPQIDGRKIPDADDILDESDHEIKFTSTTVSEQLYEAEAKISKDKPTTDRKSLAADGSPEIDVILDESDHKIVSTLMTVSELHDEAEPEISKDVSVEKQPAELTQQINLSAEKKDPLNEGFLETHKLKKLSDEISTKNLLTEDNNETPGIVPGATKEEYVLKKSEMEEGSITVKIYEDAKKITVDGEQSQVTPKEITEAHEDEDKSTKTEVVMEVVKHDPQNISEKVSGVITSEVKDKIDILEKDVKISSSSLYEEMKDISKGLLDKKMFDETTYSITSLLNDTDNSVETLKDVSSVMQKTEEIICPKDVKESAVIEPTQVAHKLIEEGRTDPSEGIEISDDSRSVLRESISFDKKHEKSVNEESKQTKSTPDQQKDNSNEISILPLYGPLKSKEFVISSEMKEPLEYGEKDDEVPDVGFEKMEGAIEQHKEGVKDISDPHLLVSKCKDTDHEEYSVDRDLNSKTDENIPEFEKLAMKYEKFTKDIESGDEGSESHISPGIKTPEPDGEEILERKIRKRDTGGITSDLESGNGNVSDVADIPKSITPCVKETIESITKYEEPHQKDKLESKLENIEGKISEKGEIFKNTTEKVEDMNKSIILLKSQMSVTEAVEEESSKKGDSPRSHHRMEEVTEDDPKTAEIMSNSEDSGTVDSGKSESPKPPTESGENFVEDLKLPIITSGSILETDIPGTGESTKTEKSVVESPKILEREHTEISDLEQDETHEQKKILTPAEIFETTDERKKSSEIHEGIETAAKIIKYSGKSAAEILEGEERITNDEEISHVDDKQVLKEQPEDLKLKFDGVEEKLISDDSIKISKEEQHGKADAEKDVEEIEGCKNIAESLEVKLEQSATDLEKIFEKVQDLSRSVIFETCDSRDEKDDDQKLRELPKQQEEISKDSSEESMKSLEYKKSEAKPEKKQEEFCEKSDAEKNVDGEKKSDQVIKGGATETYDAVDSEKSIIGKVTDEGQEEKSESDVEITILKDKKADTESISQSVVFEAYETNEKSVSNEVSSTEMTKEVHHEKSETDEISKHEKAGDNISKSVVLETDQVEKISDSKHPIPEEVILEEQGKLRTDAHHELSYTKTEVAIGMETKHEKSLLEKSEKFDVEMKIGVCPIFDKVTKQECEKTSRALHNGFDEEQIDSGKKSKQEGVIMEEQEKLPNDTSEGFYSLVSESGEGIHKKPEEIMMIAHHDESDVGSKVSQAEESEKPTKDTPKTAQVFPHSIITENSEGVCEEHVESADSHLEKSDTEKENHEQILECHSEAVQGISQTAVPEKFERICEKTVITSEDVKPHTESKVYVDPKSDKCTEQESESLKEPDMILINALGAIQDISETIVSEGTGGEHEKTSIDIHYEKSDTEKQVDDGIESKQGEPLSKKSVKSLEESVAPEKTGGACQKIQELSTDIPHEKSEATKIEIDPKSHEVTGKGKIILGKSDELSKDTPKAVQDTSLSIVSAKSVGTCRESEKIPEDIYHEKSDAEKKNDVYEKSKEESIVEKSEKLLKDSSEHIQVLSQSVISESCKNTDKSDITDGEKSDPEKHVEIASESSEQMEKVVISLEKTSEKLKEISEKTADISRPTVFAKCEYAGINKSTTDGATLEKQEDAPTKKISETLGHVGDISKFLESERTMSVADISTRKDEKREELDTEECTEKCIEPCQKYSDTKEQDAKTNIISSTIEKIGYKSAELEKGENETMEKCDKECEPKSSTTQQSIISNIANQDLEETPITLAGPSTALKSKKEVQKQIEIQETLLHEKHIPGTVTPPTVPVSPNILDDTMKFTTGSQAAIKEVDVRSITPVSDDSEIIGSTHTDISEQVSKVHLDKESDDDDQLSIMSQIAHSRESSHCKFDDEFRKVDPMSMSLYGSLPVETSSEQDSDTSIPVETEKTKYLAPFVDKTDVDLAESIDYAKTGSSPIDDASSSSMSQEKKDPLESWGKPLELPAPTYLYEITKAKFSRGVHSTSPKGKVSAIEQQSESAEEENHHFRHEQLDVMSASFYGDLPSDEKDPLSSWGKPLGLPSPAPPNDNKGTPKKERKLPPNVSAKNKLNDDRKRAESPSKYNNRNKKITPVYVDLTYVPHHGNTNYSYIDFFKRVRARYYVFSGIEPSRDVYNALLEAKQTWEDKELEVTIIPTYDTDILGYWVAENEEMLSKYKIDLSPSASRCTINLQDHETSCSAYRLEF